MTTQPHAVRIAPAIARPFAGSAVRLPEGIELLGPVYWIAGAIISCGAFYLGGIETLTFSLAGLIALWTLARPRAGLSLSIWFMVYLFVFFQREAPLGQELPEEFFYWGAGLALITGALIASIVFSGGIDRGAARERMGSAPCLAMAAFLVVILMAAVNGLALGVQPFAAARQLSGCLLFPLYFFMSLSILRTSRDIDRWLLSSSWAVALGSLWYAGKLSLASVSIGGYYREQSPLTCYAGAVAAIGFATLLGSRSRARRALAAGQAFICVLAIVLMGNRASLASFMVTAGLIAIVTIGRRGTLAAGIAALAITGTIAAGFYFGNRLLDRRGFGGDVARRFIISVSEDISFQGRMSQMDSVLRTVRERPILGAGLGSETVFIAPEEGRLRVTSVDNGWGYVLLKLGLLGMAALFSVLGLFLRRALRGLWGVPPGALRTSGLALAGTLVYGIVVFWGGPSLLHFTSAGFFGTTLAAILVLSEETSSAAGKRQ